MKKQVKAAVNAAAKRSTRVHNIVRKVGNERLQKRFEQLIEDTIPNEKTVVFLSFMGRGFSDSPFAIYLEMISNPKFDDWNFIWVFKKKKASEFNARRQFAEELIQNENIKSTDSKLFDKYLRSTTVVYNTPEYYEVLASAKYWVSNSRIQDGVQAGEHHVYIQTWHGTPLKRLGADIEVGANAVHSTENLAAIYKQEAEKWSYLLSPSSFYTEKLTSAFSINTDKVNILEDGYPRNDYLVTHTKKDEKRIKKLLGIAENKKVLLYAPTWRDNQHDLKKGYTYSVGADFEKLQKNLGDDWIILFRAHYFIANNFDFSQYENFVYDVSDYSDINELYIVADCLMTDYSSVFFDYSVLQRPIIFYMYDKEAYANELRGFYIGLDELPGEIVETNEGVIEALSDLSKYEKKYTNKLKEFKQRFCSLDDGSASKRVIKKIFKS